MILMLPRWLIFCMLYIYAVSVVTADDGVTVATDVDTVNAVDAVV